MTVFIAIVVMFLLLFVGAKPAKRSNKTAFRRPPQPSQPKSASQRPSPASPVKPSIIDVQGSAERIPTPPTSSSLPQHEPVYWPHRYIYALNDLQGVGKEQRSYYYYFKQQFGQGIYPDLKGNSNYAFILLFDLLNEYDAHRSLSRLHDELTLLGKNYPLTAPYAQNEYNQRIRESNRHLVTRLPGTSTIASTPAILDTSFISPTWETLSQKHAKTFPLTKAEASLLDNLFYSPSSFFVDPFCQSSIVALFLSLYQALDAELNKTGSSIQKVLGQLADLVALKHFHFRAGSDNYNYSISSLSNDLRQCLMKLCENAVRELYDYKRRLQVIPAYANPEIISAIETQLITPATRLLAELTKSCPAPDDKTEIIINGISPTRWKAKFEAIKESYSAGKDLKTYKEQVLRLGRLNKSNPAIENIFFEASKYIGKQDKLLCLSLYANYIYYDQRSAKIDDKGLTKTIQKALFSNQEQEAQFDAILGQLKKDKDLKRALTEISTLYQPRRKKIELNKGMIKDAEKALHETVDLLNEYLVEEEESDSDSTAESPLKLDQFSSATPDPGYPTHLTLSMSPSPDSNVAASTYLAELHLTPVQTGLLTRFKRHRFLLSGEDIEIFARSQNYFTNQLINSINEACYEWLDDSLIEQENENYIINEEYYKRLLAS